MMVRIVYAGLLLMHPPAFRRRFMAEMLYIFDQAALSASAIPLLCDALVSLARQWVLRSGAWKLAAAVLGACLQVAAGGLVWTALRHDGRWQGNAPAPDLPALEGLLRFSLVSIGAIVLMVVMASLWMGRFMRKRR
jgi:hypothetical protein